MLDAWEHAYYLQYGPEKKTYFEAIWNVWNWADAGRRFESVRGIDLALRQRRLTPACGRSLSKNRLETSLAGKR